MENHILRLPGKRTEELILLCPICNSSNVIVSLDIAGYYEIILCKSCGYEREKKIKYYIQE